MRRLRKRKEGEEAAKERKDFLGFARSHFRAQKKPRFPGPIPSSPLVTDLARLKTIT
jgi:hypothetical protein